MTTRLKFFSTISCDTDCPKCGFPETLVDLYQNREGGFQKKNRRCYRCSPELRVTPELAKGARA